MHSLGLETVPKSTIIALSTSMVAQADKGRDASITPDNYSGSLRAHTTTEVRPCFVRVTTSMTPSFDCYLVINPLSILRIIP